MMTDWRDEFDRAIIDRNKAVWDAIEWKARAEAAEGALRELRENVLLGLGMTAEDVATLDDDLVDPTISYLLGGYKELAVELEAIPIRFIDGQGYRCWPVTVTAHATTGQQTDDPALG